MARQLWLLRHGDAEPYEASRPDAERRLTERGHRQSRDAGTALARLGLQPAAIFSSPKIRAHATATAVALTLDVDVVLHEPLAEDFDVDEARTLLAAAPDNGSVLVVGHEPDLSQVMHDLTGSRLHFKKGGVAAIRLDTLSGPGELVVLLRPRELAAVAG